MVKASDNAYPSLLITEGTEPSAPAAGKQRVYIDSTSHHLMRTNSSGTETDIETAPASDPAWTAYTPVWTPEGGGSNAIVNGTLTGFFITTGKTHKFRVQLTIGSSTTFGTGRWNFTVGGSVSTSGMGTQMVACWMFDSSTAVPHGGGAWLPAQAGAIVRPTPAGSGAINGISSAVPWTWATSDQLVVQGVIEIA